MTNLRKRLYNYSSTAAKKKIRMLRSIARIGTQRLSVGSRTAVSSYTPRVVGTARCLSTGETVKLRFFEESNNATIEVEAPLGKTVLDVALTNNVDIEGACGGELACSTCHVVVPKDVYDKLPKKKLEEEDMLDLAWGLTDT
jgi:2Fe-2S ferredoxin